MENTYKAFLIKYAEIGIKGQNRYYFENALKDRIKDALRDVEGDFHVTKEMGRIYVEALTEFDYDETLDALKHVYGIWSISPVAISFSTEWEDICQAGIDYVRKTFDNTEFTFKVEAKRGDKSYPMKSPEIEAKLGGCLLDAFPGLKVDVHEPQVRIMVEVRQRVYFYSVSIPGPGGMPVGCNGKAMLLLSGGIDSPVAGCMIAKRGVTIDAVYFHAPPYTSERAKQKVVDLARIMARYTGPIRLHVINFTDIQLAIYDKCPHDELTIIMRRYMMRIAEKLALDAGCHGLVTGESIGQVASQTMQSLICTNEVCTLPVYRPLIAFDKQDIVELSEKYGTFETSILPFEDCCTIFVAKHPVTKPNRSVIRSSEKKLEDVIDPLMEAAFASDQVLLIDKSGETGAPVSPEE